LPQREAGPRHRDTTAALRVLAALGPAPAAIYLPPSRALRLAVPEARKAVLRGVRPGACGLNG